MKFNIKKTILFPKVIVEKIEEQIKHKAMIGFNFSDYVRQAVTEKLQKDEKAAN